MVQRNEEGEEGKANRKDTEEEVGETAKKMVSSRRKMGRKRNWEERDGKWERK